MTRKWITPYAYTDDDESLHLCCNRLLEETGLPVTEENIRLAAQALEEQVRQTHPTIKTVSRVE